MLIVVSALSGVTDLLKRIAESGADESVARDAQVDIVARHDALLADLELPLRNALEGWLARLDQLIADARRATRALDWQAEVFSLGELMSSTLGARFLIAQGLDAHWLDARGVKSDITKASLAPWLAHSGQPGVSLYPSLSPSAPVVPPVPIDAPPTIVIQGATPAVVPDSSEAGRVLVVGSRPKREPARAVTTAQRRAPVSRRWHWFAGAAAASFIGAAVASMIGSREVASARPRLTAPVVEVARVEPKPAAVATPVPVAAQPTSEPAAAPVRKARTTPRAPRPRPAARPPRADELKNPFR